MRSGPDVSASCVKCWKPVFKNKEVVMWKYGLVGYREKKPDESQQQAQSVQTGGASSCEHKILKVYRSDRYVAARCLNCDTLLSSLSEQRLIRNAIIKPRIEVGSAVVRGRQRTEPSQLARTPELASA
jgi:predicted nucleic-acid-binding Zn-ribbon protein